MATVMQRFGLRVFERHGKHCFYCGRSDRTLTLDHIIPKKRGGKSTFNNLVPACGRCNSAKGDRPIAEVRNNLVLSMLNWPRFTPDQLQWLRGAGFDMRPFDTAVLACENSAQSNDCLKSVKDKNISNLGISVECVAELI